MLTDSIISSIPDGSLSNSGLEFHQIDLHIVFGNEFILSCILAYTVGPLYVMSVYNSGNRCSTIEIVNISGIFQHDNAEIAQCSPAYVRHCHTGYAMVLSDSVKHIWSYFIESQ